MTASQATMPSSAHEALIADYIERCRPHAERELRYFKVLRSLDEAVSRASLAELPSGKRHPHQRRIPRNALENSRKLLLDNLPLLQEADTFEDLLHTINTLIRPIRKIGELAVYDTALRIGARLDLEPAKVYVHAGTRTGAVALGFDGRRKSIEMDELSSVFQQLRPREVEDFLCIYKQRLR